MAALYVKRAEAIYYECGFRGSSSSSMPKWTAQFSTFIVERTMPGVSIGPEEKKMGIKGSSTCPLILDDVKCRRKFAVGGRQRSSDRFQHFEYWTLQAGGGLSWCLQGSSRLARNMRIYVTNSASRSPPSRSFAEARRDEYCAPTCWKAWCTAPPDYGRDACLRSTRRFSQRH